VLSLILSAFLAQILSMMSAAFADGPTDLKPWVSELGQLTVQHLLTSALNVSGEPRLINPQPVARYGAVMAHSLAVATRGQY